MVCSDEAEHRQRVESRRSDIEGLRLPTWGQVMERDYEPWDRERLVLDTAKLTADAAVETVVNRALNMLRPSGPAVPIL